MRKKSKNLVRNERKPQAKPGNLGEKKTEKILGEIEKIVQKNGGEKIVTGDELRRYIHICDDSAVISGKAQE